MWSEIIDNSPTFLNEVNNPFEALSLYRNKDIVEKAFGNLKERLNFRRCRFHPNCP